MHFVYIYTLFRHVSTNFKGNLNTLDLNLSNENALFLRSGWFRLSCKPKLVMFLKYRASYLLKLTTWWHVEVAIYKRACDTQKNVPLLSRLLEESHITTNIMVCHSNQNHVVPSRDFRWVRWHYLQTLFAYTEKRAFSSLRAALNSRWQGSTFRRDLNASEYSSFLYDSVTRKFEFMIGTAGTIYWLQCLQP